MHRRYTVILTPEPDSSAVIVRAPALPGVHTWGRGKADALASAREAIALHLEGYAERGLPAPTDHGLRTRVATVATCQPARLTRLGRRPVTPSQRVVTIDVPALIGA